MAPTATRPTAVLALLAALLPLAGCAAFEPSAADASGRLPGSKWGPPRMRAPSAERPAWLPSPPADPERLPAPNGGFRA